MRTQSEIEQEILQAKSSYTELSGLDSVSQTAIWRLWVKVTAYAHFVLERLFEVFRAEIAETIKANRTGTLAWYVQKAKEFQNGDTLNAQGKYEVISPEKQIITRCSVREVAGGIALKVAKGEPATPLDAVELQNLTTYISKIKFAGVEANIINLPAEPVLVNIKVFYSQVGEQIAKDNVKQAIKEYVAQVAFDGEFVANDMIALCRTKQGVVDVVVNTITINGTPITDGRNTAQSGYYAFDGENAGNNYNMIVL